MRIGIAVPTPSSLPQTARTPSRPGKRAVNLTLSIDTLDAAKSLNINLSQACDAYLRQLVRHEQERQWRKQHTAFIDAYNSTVQQEGLPLTEWRDF